MAENTSDIGRLWHTHESRLSNGSECDELRYEERVIE